MRNEFTFKFDRKHYSWKLSFFTLIALRPITLNLFSKSWHYYCLFVPIFFLLGGTHIAVNLTELIPPVEQSSYLTMTTHNVSTNISHEIFEFLENNDSIGTPVSGWEVDIAFVVPPYITDRLLTHLEVITPPLLSLWTLGALVFVIIHVKEYLQYRRLVMHNAKNIGSNNKIPIVVSVAAHTPMLMGVAKPVIVLPDMHFSDEEFKMILSHEMVHFRRKDLLVKMLMLLVNAAHWFNPAVYMLSNQLDTMCELSCDEKVVAEMDAGKRKLYGETILQVLRHSTAQVGLVGNVAFVTNLCHSKKKFKRRLINMMNTKKMKKSVIALAFATGLLVIGGGFVVSGMIDSALPNVPIFTDELESNNITEPPAQNITPSSQSSIQEEPLENSATQAQFQWPLSEHVRVTAPFGLVVDPLTREETFHSGIDIPAPFGTPILAAMDGYVAFAGWQDGNGYTILIDHGNDYSTLYAHASRISVNEGQFVSQGETIAFVGSTGHSTGYHLHFEVRFSGVAVDPYTYFSGTAAMRVDNRTTTDAVIHAPLFSNIYTIELADMNIGFELMHVYFDEGYPILPDNYLTFEAAARIVADATYQKFGVSIDGMTGNMFFVERMYDNSWIGNIFCEESTTHSHANELFHFVIDAANGNVLSLYMNTVDTPFHG